MTGASLDLEEVPVWSTGVVFSVSSFLGRHLRGREEVGTGEFFRDSASMEATPLRKQLEGTGVGMAYKTTRCWGCSAAGEFDG